MSTVAARMNFYPASETGGPIRHVDFRQPAEGPAPVSAEVSVFDARENENIGLHKSGFELVHSTSAVRNFYDADEVIETYYKECQALATKLTGAHTTFTYDHIIREPGKQFSAGGTGADQKETGENRGGGYIGTVHMDYTDNTTWDRYLGLHGETVPKADHIYALNFWRPISASVDDNPLAVCDARTVRTTDLQETVVYGYGADTYSWHDIGIETFSVSTGEHQQWYYYPGMTPDDVLIIKSYDSNGVIGTTCPHASFPHPQPKGLERRSIELRVLCFC